MGWAEVILLSDHSNRCYQQGWISEACRHVVRSEGVSLHNEADDCVTRLLCLGGLRREGVHHAVPHIEVGVLEDDDHHAYWAMEVAKSVLLFLGHHTLKNPNYARHRCGKEALDPSEGHESGQLDQDAVKYQNEEEPWLSL